MYAVISLAYFWQNCPYHLFLKHSENTLATREESIKPSSPFTDIWLKIFSILAKERTGKQLLVNTGIICFSSERTWSGSMSKALLPHRKHHGPCNSSVALLSLFASGSEMHLFYSIIIATWPGNFLTHSKTATTLLWTDAQEDGLKKEYEQ